MNVSAMLMDASISRYAGEGTFYTALANDGARELPVFIPKIYKNVSTEEENSLAYVSERINELKRKAIEEILIKINALKN